jgi:PII-like signaling protein
MRNFVGENLLIRIFIAEGDRFEHRPLYEALVEMLREEGFAGATVLRGVSGFGAHSVYHSQKLLDLSADLPMIIEAVESEEKINAVMPQIDAMMSGGMVTMEKVRVIRYR